MCDPPKVLLGPGVRAAQGRGVREPSQGLAFIPSECGQWAHITVGRAAGAGLSYSPGMLEAQSSLELPRGVSAKRRQAEEPP